MKSIKAYIKNVALRLIADMRTYGIGICGLFAYEWMMRKMFRVVCPFVLVTGFPCAGCGLTRSISYLLQGQFEKSISYHPLGFVWALWSIYAVVWRYLLGRQGKWILRTLVTVCVVTLGVYIYRIVTVFPGEPPMSYYHQKGLDKLWNIC